MSSAPPAPAALPASERDRSVVFAAVLMTLFLAALDQTIVSTALPAMVEDLQGVDRYAWVATAYLLTSTAFALVYGKLADTYARRPITLGAVLLFLAGSVLCGLAGELGRLPLLGDGMTQLVVFRGLQGIGGGGIFAMAFIVIADLFTPAERGRYQGYVGAVFGLASVLGPLAGGILTDRAGGLIPGVEGWRWVFYVNVPFGVLALWFIVRRMPRLDPLGERRPPDLVAAALLLLGLVPAILALQLDKRTHPWFPGTAEGTASGWQAWATPGLLALGAVGLLLFARRSKRSASPVLDPRLFHNRVFRTANLATFFFGAALMSITIFLPLLLVNVVGVSATQAGAALIPFSAGVVFSATVAGHLVNRIGYRRQIVAGGVLFTAGVILLATLGEGGSYGRITLYVLLSGLGAGPSMPLFTLAVQNAVDVRMVGQATSAAQFFRQIGATVGAALMGTVLATTLAVSFVGLEVPEEVLAGASVTTEELASTGGAELPGRIRAYYERRAEAAASPAAAESLRGEGARAAERTAQAITDAFSRATTRIYWMTAAMVALATVLSLLIPELALRTTHDRESVAPAG